MNIQSVASAGMPMRAPEVENDGDADDQQAKSAAPAKQLGVQAPQVGETFSILA